MGRRGSFGRDFDPTFIVPWGKSKVIMVYSSVGEIQGNYGL